MRASLQLVWAPFSVGRLLPLNVVSVFVILMQLLCVAVVTLVCGWMEIFTMAVATVVLPTTTNPFRKAKILFAADLKSGHLCKWNKLSK